MVATLALAACGRSAQPGFDPTSPAPSTTTAAAPAAAASVEVARSSSPVPVYASPAATAAPVLHTAVAVGSPAAPTPTGRFSLVDKLDTGSSGSAYGPFALGLSAHSDVLTEFGGGDGQIGIHGTNDPTSIGQAVSHGCIRVPNDVILRLASALPLGTPVLVLE
ncbi:MAG: L,D-transpeptidase [Acidimicrobiales bacterium]